MDTSHTAVFESHRDHLFGVAYRMLGRASRAEDIVQDAFLRWREVDPDTVSSPKAYLTTVVTRLCLDELKSARARREEYVGPWLPEPLVATRAEDPAWTAELADSLSMAFLVMLETLTPVQRAVFLLREVFDYDYAEVAGLVDKTEAHCRKIAQRARNRVTEHEPRFDASRAEQERLVERFFAAVEAGDMEPLETMLAEEAILYSDGGGKVTAAQRPIYGADRITRFMLGIADKVPEGTELHFVEVNGQPGVLATVDGRPHSTWAFHVQDGRIQRIFVVLNPDKLSQ